jgi:hypothetical protein
VFPDRTLDLELKNKKGADTDCEEWVGAFRWLMGSSTTPQALPTDWRSFVWCVKDVYAHFVGTEVNLLVQKGRLFVKKVIIILVIYRLLMHVSSISLHVNSLYWVVKVN